MKNLERGSALILVLWCTLILSIAILATARVIEWGIQSQRADSRRFDAKQLAYTGIAYSCDPRIEKTDPLLKQDFGKIKKLRVFVGSEGGRININRLLAREDYRLLSDLFRLWGLEQKEAVALTDNFRDWVSSSRLHSQHGTLQQGDERDPFFLPENRPFLTVAEMHRVKGCNQLDRIKPDWVDSFSTLSAGRLDIQEATADMLIVFGKLTRTQAENFVAYRNGPDRKPNTEDDIKITSLESVAAIAGLSPLQQEALMRNFQIGGNPVRITSTAYIGDTRYRVVAVMANRGSKELLWWEEK